MSFRTVPAVPKKNIEQDSKIKFPRGGKCRVCHHPQHGRINQEILSGKKRSDICTEYNISYASLFNHIKKHLPDLITFADAERAKEIAKESEEQQRKEDRKKEVINTLSVMEDTRLVFGRKASKDLAGFKVGLQQIFTKSYTDYMANSKKEDGALTLSAAKDWAFLTGLQAKVVDRMHEISIEEARAEFDIFSSPELQQFLSLLYRLLAPFPEARDKVSKGILAFLENDCQLIDLPGAEETIDV